MDDIKFEWHKILKKLISSIDEHRDLDEDSPIGNYLSSSKDKVSKLLEIKLIYVVDIFQRIEEISYKDSIEKNMSDQYRKEIDFKEKEIVPEKTPNSAKVRRLVLKFLKLFVVRYLNNNTLDKKDKEKPIGALLSGGDVGLLEFGFLKSKLVESGHKKIYERAKEVLLGLGQKCEHINELIKHLVSQVKSDD